MAYTKKEREEYNKHRERTSTELGISKNEYNRLRRAAQALHRHDEDSAMGRTDWRHNSRGVGSKEYSEKAYTKDVGKAFSKTKALKGRINLYHQQDPRGATLYAGKKRLKPETYHSEGRVIY